MKKRKLLSRVLCLILCLCLAIELIPSEAYANTLKGIDPQLELSKAKKKGQ